MVRKSKKESAVVPDEVMAAIREIVWMARRYAHGRHTYAPSAFNEAYNVLYKHFRDNIELVNEDAIIPTFPYAYDPNRDY